MWIKLVTLLVIFSYIVLFSEDYVLEENLEQGGFGLYDNIDDGYSKYQDLLTGIISLKVSPDGKYIAFLTLKNFYIYEMMTKTYDTIQNGAVNFTWSPDSKNLLFTYSDGITFSRMIYNVNSKFYELFLKNLKSFPINQIDSKGKMYFFPSIDINKDSSLYLVDYNKSYKEKVYFSEKINLKYDDLKKYSLPYPIYNNENYFIVNKNTNSVYKNQCYEVSNSFILDYCSFIKLDTNFKQFSESEIVFNEPNIYNVRVGEPNLMYDRIKITKNNEMFVFLNVRHSTEIKYISFTKWDSTTIKARNKSGYYRMDTNCGNMKQLVRMWANVGGITTTGDGETIYYGYMKPNRNCVIMKMNKYGKNKEVVIDLEYFEGQTSVEDNPTTINSIIYFPNPSKDILTIKLTNERLHSEPLPNEEIEVYDLMGQNLLSQKIDSQVSNINIQKLNTGIYYCKLKQNGTVFKFEVVK
jgi:hypothetical protein